MWWSKKNIADISVKLNNTEVLKYKYLKLVLKVAVGNFGVNINNFTVFYLEKMS